MKQFFEHWFVHLANHLFSRQERRPGGGLPLGRIVVDGRVTDDCLLVPQSVLEASSFALGVSGSGKTSLLHHVLVEGVHRNWGLDPIILHPDQFPFFVATIAEEERRRGTDLSNRCLFINLLDRQWATGLNLLQVTDSHELFVLAAELAEMIRVRFELDSIGVRILELLRNTVYVLAFTGHTLAEVRLFLTNPVFRASLLRQITNSEIKAYFEDHFDRLSEAERATYSAALLNKISELIADPLIRDVIGQRHSAISLSQALDGGMWVALNADKAVLREQGATIAALYFIRLRNAIMARRTKRFVLIACDEAANLLRYDAGLELVLQEIRKWHTGLFCVAQSLEQLTGAARAALLGCGTQCYFRLSAPDAEKVAGYLDGGKRLAERLKTLPQRHMIVKSADQRWQEVVVPNVTQPRADAAGFYNRVMQRWAKPRAEVEQEIRNRHEQFSQTSKSSNLETWE